MFRCVVIHAADEEIKEIKDVMVLLYQSTVLDIDVVLLGCNAVWTCRQKNMLSPSSGLKSRTTPEFA
jgi:hypothetical protein